MAVVRSQNFSVEDVLSQDIFNESTSQSEQPANCFSQLRKVLSDVARDEGIADAQYFVDTCTAQVKTVLEMSRNSAVNKVLNIKPINAAPILRKEEKLWLADIRRRIGGRRSVRNPYYGEINRDFPMEIFLVILKILRGLDGFVEPFCYHRENSKAIVVSFTSMRLVNELFSLLCGLSKDVVTTYFKRNFSGARKGHTAAIIVNDLKDFALIYKKRSGKLVIGFNYGEWNVNGFPQHAC